MKHAVAARAREVAIMAASALLLSACAADQTGAVLAPAAITPPPEAPKVTGRARPASDADHAKLVASFGGEYRSPGALALVTDVTDRWCAPPTSPTKPTP